MPLIQNKGVLRDHILGSNVQILETSPKMLHNLPSLSDPQLPLIFDYRNVVPFPLGKGRNMEKRSVPIPLDHSVQPRLQQLEITLLIQNSLQLTKELVLKSNKKGARIVGQRLLGTINSSQNPPLFLMYIAKVVFIPRCCIL